MERTLFILLTLLLAFGIGACGASGADESSPPASAETTAGDEQPLVAPGETEIGDRSTCPVSGEEFVVSESSPSVEHEGRTYHFCCPGCASRFDADPEKYLDGSEEEADPAY